MEYVEQTSATMPKWSKNYIYLGGRLLATEAPSGTGEIVQYHHPDRLGTKLVTNNLDTTSFSQANLPFGTALDAEATGVGTTNRRFTSYDRSATTGLDYAVNRQYDPRQGRFTQPDPLGMAAASLADPQSLNMYSYVGNDPVNRVDPDGQFWGALFQFIVGLFKSLKPNVINGSFTYHNAPPISVSFTPNFQNIGVGFAGVGFTLRSNGHWLPEVLGRGESLDPQNAEQRAIDDAVADALSILSTDNSCSQFFGGFSPSNGSRDGTEALKALATVLRPGNISAINTITGIQLSNFGTVVNAQTGFEYRLPASAIVNRIGPFFRNGRIGSFSSISRAGRALAILHEVAHLIRVGELIQIDDQGSVSVSSIYRIPNDGTDPDVSRENTKRVEAACKNELRALK